MVKKIIAALVAIVIIAGLYFVIFHKSDKDRVKRQLALLSDYASKYPGEGAAVMLMKTQAVGGLFDEHCGLEVGDDFFSGDYTPEEISSKSVMMRRQFSNALISFYDINVDFPEKDKALVTLTARFTGVVSGGETVNQVRELQVTLNRKNGKWLFAEFKIVTVLKK
ncbi:MAG: hypothetical protein A2017_20560 [Lentisphaerae bacterium GWF2_44_16]|nr:MAG: hypothetical protein A2017_20560 [Lentisphaerae bacterium GWF2_44_16]